MSSGRVPSNPVQSCMHRSAPLGHCADATSGTSRARAIRERMCVTTHYCTTGCEKTPETTPVCIASSPFFRQTPSSLPSVDFSVRHLASPQQDGQDGPLGLPPTRHRFSRYWPKAPLGKRLRRGIIGGIVLGVLYIAYLWFTLPDISNPRAFIADQSSVITDRNGVELYRLFSEEDRTELAGNLIPKHLKNAVIAIEDERFYTRGCMDVRAIARAIIFLGRSGGASTITRQLARNALDLKRENL